MKKLLQILIICFGIYSCKAQNIIPVENYRQYLDDEIEIPDGSYIKDVSNLLDKYVGIWKGSYNNRNYEFVVMKRTVSFLRITVDQLNIKYKIVNSDGSILENTLNLSDESILVIKGNYLARTKTYYVLDYLGRDTACGQEGFIFIKVYGIGYNNMSLFLEPGRDLIDGEACPNGTTQILPTDWINLTKQ